MMRSIVALCFLAACTAAAPGGGAASKAAALALLKKYDDAWLRKDSAAFAAVLSPSYVYFTSNGGVMDRAKLLAMLSSPDYVVHSGSRTELQAYETGDVVVISTRWRGLGLYRSKPFSDDQRCSVIVSHGLVLAEHCTNRTPPAVE